MHWIALVFMQIILKKMFQISMNIIRDLINHLQNKLDLKILTIRIWKLI